MPWAPTPTLASRSATWSRPSRSRTGRQPRRQSACHPRTAAASPDSWSPMQHAPSAFRAASTLDSAHSPNPLPWPFGPTSAALEPGPIVVVGAGPIGLGIIAVAAASDRHLLIAVEPSPERRDAALRMGADVACEPGTTLSELLAEAGHEASTISPLLTNEPAVAHRLRVRRPSRSGPSTLGRGTTAQPHRVGRRVPRAGRDEPTASHHQRGHGDHQLRLSTGRLRHCDAPSERAALAFRGARHQRTPPRGGRRRVRRPGQRPQGGQDPDPPK